MSGRGARRGWTREVVKWRGAEPVGARLVATARAPRLQTVRYGNFPLKFRASSKILQKFSDFLSHRIFKRMHEVLNIDENKN